MVKISNVISRMVFLLVISVSFVSCSGSDSRYEFSYEGQEFRIVPVYEGQARYAEAISDSRDYDALRRENVVEPYRDECFSGEYEGIASARVSQPILDFTRLSDGVDALRASDVSQVVEESLKESADALPGGDTNVCILISGDRDALIFSEGDLGASGFASGSDSFSVILDTQNNWREWTPSVVAHEYHHTVWTRWWIEENPDETPPFYLANYLVFEGRAESFASELYPDMETPYTDALSAEEEREMWEKMNRNLDEDDPELLNQYAFGGPEAPTWTLYTIGYDIVQSYIERNPDVSTEELLRKEPEEIISESGYDGR